MSDKNCLFCKIIAGEIPGSKIYEDEKVFAFLDINPNSLGHTLLCPKEHYENTLETPEELLAHLVKIAKKITPKIVEAIGADGSNFFINNGETAGQVIFHTHWHIIPRFKNDDFQYGGNKPYPAGEEKKVAEKIKQNL